MTIQDYRQFEQLTITDLELLEQVYYRLQGEGYSAGFDFADFLDIVCARGDHKFNEFYEMDLLEDSHVE